MYVSSTVLRSINLCQGMSGKSGRPAIESRGTACMNEIE